MSRKYKAGNPGRIYFITNTLIDWGNLFTRPEYKGILIKSLKYCIDNKGLVVHAYVIMTNHLHLIVSTGEVVELPKVIYGFGVKGKEFRKERLPSRSYNPGDWIYVLYLASNPEENEILNNRRVALSDTLLNVQLTYIKPSEQEIRDAMLGKVRKEYYQ